MAYGVLALKLACPAFLVGYGLAAWLGVGVGVCAGVLVYWVLLSLFVGGRTFNGLD